MKTQRSSRPANRRRGASMVEFSLVFVLFLTLVGGVFEIGRAIWVYSSVTHAAKHASRYAMIHGSRNPLEDDQKSIEDYVEANLVGIDTDKVTTTAVYSPDDKAGSTVTITVAYTMDFILGPLVGIGDTIRLQSTSVKTVLN